MRDRRSAYFGGIDTKNLPPKLHWDSSRTRGTMCAAKSKRWPKSLADDEDEIRSKDANLSNRSAATTASSNTQEDQGAAATSLQSSEVAASSTITPALSPHS